MSGRTRPADGDQGDGIGVALRMLTQARRALDEATVACGIDPEEGTVIDPERCTPVNLRRLAEVADRVVPPAVLKAREVAR